jgi:outer membrane receptor protein involved in Fe transport
VLYSAGVPLLVLLAILGLSTPAVAGQRSSELKGVVVDASGAPVSGATVRVAGGVSATTADDGTFQVAVPSGSAALITTAPGFTALDSTVAEDAQSVRLVLQPAPLEDKVLVTASRGVENLGTAGSTTVVSSAELLNSGAGALDDTLRNTPGFSLFRRSSSRVANPTTQGVTLRGVSGSGASRTLVLADGIPLNDPFGTWVYWNRVPQAAVERVEIVRGATGDLYGADALGGVVQVLTFAPGQTRLRVTADGGSHDTGRVSAFGGMQRGGWFGEGAGELVRTKGIVIVGEEVRGPIDVPADSDYQTGFLGGGYNAGAWHVGMRVSLYDEDRGNGTPYQVNTTEWTQVSGEGGGSVGGGAWAAHASGGTQEYYQTFSRIITVQGVDRAGEVPTMDQTAPSTFATGSGQWTRAWGRVTALVAGEGRYTNSTVEEIRYVSGAPTGPFLAGGKETVGAAFGRVSYAAGDAVTIVAGLRGDFWRSDPLDAALAPHSADLLSPRVSVGWRLSDMLSIQGAGYRSHRTPSLNELHRGFVAGAIVTIPNPLLDPETLTGMDGGVLFSRPAFSARVTAFTNRLENAITNVTIGPNLRQRQNTDTVRASGVELEADFRPHPRWTIGALYVATSSRFDKAPEQIEIEGNRVPQVPHYQLGGSLTYIDPRGFTAAVQARAFGPQFDDDLNQLELERYGVVDLSASQELLRGVTVFVAVENLFDKDYDVGRTPLRTVGWPRSVRAGARLFLP